VEMNEALDEVVSKLSRQIRKNKTRLEDAKKVKYIELTEAYYDEPEEEYSVVKTKKFFVKVMTVEEAVLQMNLLGHEFFMFRDDASGEVNVVYKRNDGNYGLLEPET
ncbi:MAG: HPF/RaiA family ribosome-associated protein, partial [Oscillospiraceae bacterium]